MHRFFISPQNIYEKIVHIDEKQAHHIEKVLRLKTGDMFLAFDGTGRQYTVRLAGRKDSCLLGQIDEIILLKNEPFMHLNLVQGIAKGDKMDTIVQKAVEIGITSIYPVLTKNTVVKLDKTRAEKKVNRWQSIAREACKQCRRNIIPEVKPVMNFKELMMQIGNSPAIILYENEEKTRLKEVLKEEPNRLQSDALFLIVGPEGGFSEDEIEEARTNNIIIAGLGPRILRTETAGIVGASIILYEYGDLG